MLINYPTSFVIGSDTIVVKDDQILGKPQTREEAFSMLQILSGRTHSVFTGVVDYYAKGRNYIL